jgi:formylglycine-generating enzyme required for sulfatase activity
MVFVPAGEFTMGRNDGASNEKPAHVVRLIDFYIDKYEVTNSMYRECVNAGICEPPIREDSPSQFYYFQNPVFDSYPVLYVTWNMADKFCRWRGSRLPTEAEWEKAARGDDNRIYPWGSEFLYGLSNFCDASCPNEWADRIYSDGYADTAPVGSFPQGQSPYGVFDMSGNVYEWVVDWFSEDYYLQSPYENPIGPDTGTDRVIRGGAWGDSNATNITSRAGFSPSSAYEFLGFRCALSADR